MSHSTVWRSRRECNSLTFEHYRQHHDPETGECLRPADDGLLHHDGVPWWEAKPHRWWRRCKPQTVSHGVERCSCGAIRLDGGPWLERSWRWDGG